jgi:Putative transposase
MTLHVNEFLRRFLLHVLPPGFVRIRHFGFLSTRNRAKLLPSCFRVLHATTDSAAATNTLATLVSADHSKHSNVVWLCPHCQGEMVILERLTAFDLRYRGPPALNTTAA